MFRDLHASSCTNARETSADQACRVRRTARRTTIRRPRVRATR